MDKKIKIMFCISSLGVGGAERVVSILANKLEENGYLVTILTTNNPNCVYPLNNQIKTICLHCSKDNSLSPFKRLRIRINKIKEACSTSKPDIIISFMSSTNIDVCLALRRFKVPIIVSERNDPKIDPPSKIKQLMRKALYKIPKGFVFQTPDAQAFFPKKIQARSRIILNPLDEKLPLPFGGERDKRIVASGRLENQKNYPLLFRAFKEFSKKHSDYTLEIYSSGSLKNQLEELAKELGLENKIVFKGFVSDVHDKIKSAAMYVMSSDFEGLPNALMEAMAIGMPCISTDCPCGGPRMLINHGENGMLVPVNDSEKLFEAMCYMAEHPEHASKMAQEAVKIREIANTNAITNAWLDYINTILSK